MNRQLGYHWLTSLFVINQNEQAKLAHAAGLAVSQGATLFELAPYQLNQLSAHRTAQVLLETGITHATYCRFFAGDGSWGDPLADEKSPLLTTALDTMRRDLEFIAELQQQGLEVPFMTGPSCFRIGHSEGSPIDYTLYRPSDDSDPSGYAPGGRVPQANFHRAMAYYYRVEEILKELGLSETGFRIAIEYLRPAEDNVFRGILDMASFLDALKSKHFAFHADTYHMTERGEDPHRVIIEAGEHLAYLHAHGSNRLPAGRYTPGGYQTNDHVASTDRVNWHLVSAALDYIKYTGPIVPEPFGAEVPQEIRQGLPDPIDPTLFFEETLRHFRLTGVLKR